MAAAPLIVAVILYGALLALAVFLVSRPEGFALQVVPVAKRKRP